MGKVELKEVSQQKLNMKFLQLTWLAQGLFVQHGSDVRNGGIAHANLDVRNGGSGGLLWFDDMMDVIEVKSTDCCFT